MPRSRLKPLDPAKVAFLKCQGVSQSKISQKLDLAEATVSRMLSEKGGVSSPYIKPPEFDWSRVTESEKVEILALYDVDGFSPALTAHLLDIAPPNMRIAATVVLANTGVSNTEAQRTGLTIFYEGAARRVWELLTPANVIGITWGQTLSLLLEAVRKLRLAPRYSGEQVPKIVPLCGESLGARGPSSMSSSALAQGFGQALTARPADDYLSLNMIPAFLPGPRAFQQHEIDAVKKLLRYSLAYKAIFGDGHENEQPLIDQIDIVITSISRKDHPFGMEDRLEFTWKTLELSNLTELMIGDLAGIPLAHSESAAKDISLLLDRWTGLQKHHLENCARRASASSQPPAGVIVVAAGRDRAPCIVEAVRQGLVNHLVVNEELGRALIEMIGDDQKPLAVGSGKR